MTGHPAGILTGEQMVWVSGPVKCQALKLTLCHEVVLFGLALAVYAGTVVDFARAGYTLPVELAEVHMDWTVVGIGALPGEVVGPDLAIVEKVAEQPELVRIDLSVVGLTAEHCMATVLERSLAVERSVNTLVHLVRVVVHTH